MLVRSPRDVYKRQLHDRLQQTAFLNKNLKIVLRDERSVEPQVEEFCYAGGIDVYKRQPRHEKES